MSKVYHIVEGVAEQSNYNWKLVLCEDGKFGYTTSEKISVGDDVTIEERKSIYRYYVKVR